MSLAPDHHAACRHFLPLGRVSIADYVKSQRLRVVRHAVLGYRESDIGGVLENIVFLELLRRGYKVEVGKLGDREVDFIATRAKERRYIQVAYLLATPRVVEREFGVLRDIPDNYPKCVISMNTAFGDDIDGIRRQNLADFLLEGG